MKVNLDTIKQARERIAGVIRKTPLEHAPGISQLVGTQLFFKCENFQLTGSFKMRGALNKITSLQAEEKKRGVIAASAGNHAQGVALSSAKLGVASTVVMPRNSSIVKQMATKSYGAEVLLHGDIYDDAYQKARELEKKTGAIFIHPYEDELIISGQGTVGLEIHEELADVETVVCSIGGGGLISGVAVALKTLNPKIKVYGVVADVAQGMLSLFQKKPIEATPNVVSIADGISVKNPSPKMYENFISKYVDDIISISEDEIAEAMVLLLERSKMLVEGSGAITLAAALKRKLNLGKKSALIMSGGNVDLNLIGEILDRGLSQNGRVSRISVVVNDRPGTLSQLTKIIGDYGANILHVEHDRMAHSLHIRETLISFVLETKNFEHMDEIRQAFISAGVKVRN